MMKFLVRHLTLYHYEEPASESVAELRVCPLSTCGQELRGRKLGIEPTVGMDGHWDYFGNWVEHLSVPFPHQRLSVESISEVVTAAPPETSPYDQLTLAEARQILRSEGMTGYDFLLPTRAVPLGKILNPLPRLLCAPKQEWIDSLLEAVAWIHGNFKYQPGATDVFTPLEEIVAGREGVCQDFAHLFLALLRTAGLPARYVSGYIEAADPTQPGSADLIGAAASHAWVEVRLPGGVWLGLDPTNNQIAGERHIRVAVGRDYNDVAPMRGTYKGSSEQELSVEVHLDRIA